MQWSHNMIHSHFTLCLRARDYIKRLSQHPSYGLWMRVKGPHHYKVTALGSYVNSVTYFLESCRLQLLTAYFICYSQRLHMLYGQYTT